MEYIIYHLVTCKITLHEKVQKQKRIKIFTTKNFILSKIKNPSLGS